MTSRPRIADLFCGAGGAAMGLHRAGFDVERWDIRSQKNYPFKFHLGDAELRRHRLFGWPGRSWQNDPQITFSCKCCRNNLYSAHMKKIKLIEFKKHPQKKDIYEAIKVGEAIDIRETLSTVPHRYAAILGRKFSVRTLESKETRDELTLMRVTRIR